MGILFSAPQYEFSIIRDEWLEATLQIAQQGVFVGGPMVVRFEAALAEYIGAKDTIGTGNGTDALFLTLKALGIGSGDEVITVANTFVATVGAIYHTGARPVLVDCDDHYLIDLEQVKAAATARTKAIILVHLYGNMVDVSAIQAWAEHNGIAVLEDCAQAASASINGQKAGSIGIAGCHRFYPDKNLGSLGDGGAVTTSSTDVAVKLRKLRNHGGEIRYQHEIPGFNSRLDSLQACALLLKLLHLDEWNAHRIQAAGWYANRLSALPDITLPIHYGSDERRHVYHLYVIRIGSGRRDGLKKHLQKKGILTGINYPTPVHLLPAYGELGYAIGAFPRAERFAEQIISLPMHAALTERDADQVCSEIESFFKLR